MCIHEISLMHERAHCTLDGVQKCLIIMIVKVEIILCALAISLQDMAGFFTT